MQRIVLSGVSHFRRTNWLYYSICFACGSNPTLQGKGGDPLYEDVPRPRRSKSERKPYPTPMKVLIERAKKERQARKVQPCRVLEQPPDNGLLVPELVEVAHRVNRARESLLLSIAKLAHIIPVNRCRFCLEVHVGPVGHEIRTCTGPKSGFRCSTHIWRKGRVQDVVYFPKCFHLYDRVGKPRVGHAERFSVRKLPAILELCVQAGLDLEKYPTKRRAIPVYSIEGRIVDFESERETNDLKEPSNSWQEAGFRTKNEVLMRNLSDKDSENTMELSIRTLDSWFEMINGAKRIMEKYSVKTCGYCTEVQVGPKGHKVRLCKASKHQSRNGLHAWQEAIIDDLVTPNYVWHVRDIHGPPLTNNFKRYYGKAPAVVEMCVQGGAPVPDEYRSMMRLDVVTPEVDEVDLVA